MDDLSLAHGSIPDRVQALARIHFIAWALLFSGLAAGFWFLILLLRAGSGSLQHSLGISVITACALAVVGGIVLALLNMRRFRKLHAEATPKGSKTEAVEWNDQRIVVSKGRAMVQVDGPCVLCQAPRDADRNLVAQMRGSGAGMGLAGYAAASVKYARDKKKFGWPEGARALIVRVPICNDCKVRFPRWTLVALGLGILGSLGLLFLAKPGHGAAARGLHMAIGFAPGSIGASLALAGVLVREVPVPARIRRWKERIEVEVPAGRNLTSGS